MNEKKKKILKAILKLLGGVLVVIVFFLIIFLILHFGFNVDIKDLEDQEKIQALIEQTGAYGRLVFILISFLQVTFIPIPGAVTILTGNYLFGFWDSIWMSFLGMFIGTMFAFWIGRVVGRPFINWVVGDKDLVDEYLLKLEKKETVLLFFMYLLPFFPDDALSSISGATKITWKRFILIQILTKPIGIFATLVVMSGEYIPYSGWGIPVLIGLGVLAIVTFIIAYKNADKINSFLEKISEKITSFLK